MEKLTFEQLPQAVELLLEKISSIEHLLSAGLQTMQTAKEMLTVQEAAALMGVSLSAIYKMTHRRELPVYKPTGGKVYFRREDLMAFLSKNRIKSEHEIEKEAAEYLTRHPLNAPKRKR